MLTLVSLARLLLAGVFLWAGINKLRDCVGTRETLASFGVPAALVRPVAWALPLFECAVALLLLPPGTGWYAGLLALATLLGFTAAIAWHLSRGNTPACNCFGEISAKPIGRGTFARNAALLALAGMVAADPTASAAALSFTTAGSAELPWIALVATAAMATIIIVQWAWLLELTKQQGRLVTRLSAVEQRLAGAARPLTDVVRRVPAGGAGPGLAMGAKVPDFRLDRVEGGALGLADLLAGAKPVMLLFTNPGCGPCNALAPDVIGWQQTLSGHLAIYPVSEGSAQDNRAKGLANTLLQEKREVADTYEAWGRPSAVVVSPEGKIASRLAQGAPEIRQLVQAWGAGRQQAA